MKKIKKCPHCGSKSSPEVMEYREYVGMLLDTYDVLDDDDGCIVICSATNGGCGASSGYGESKDSAIRLWNRRDA